MLVPSSSSFLFFGIAMTFVSNGDVLAFSAHTVSPGKKSSCLNALNEPLNTSVTSRRGILSSFLTLTASATIGSSPACASLLEDFGSDPSNLSKQPEPKKEKELAVNKGKTESNLEPNLRSNYYYPTNKVRYLPRIKKCSDSIPGVAEAIGKEDWDAVRDFATVVADDTILPMKLYVSSLTGGGTNVKVGFAKDMLSAAKSFEKAQKALVNSVEKKDVAKCSAALETMSEALLAYRTSGKLLGPDGGGDIPSVDEIRRSTKRFRGDAYEAKVKERDERLKKASSKES
ncbi:hypothetical protein ACHAXS_005448 [Conticribra weissflogii]